MKKIIFLLTLCVLFCAIGSIAIAEEGQNYRIEKIVILLEEKYGNIYCESVHYFSDEEIWISFLEVKGWDKEEWYVYENLRFVKVDKEGNILEDFVLSSDWAYSVIDFGKLDGKYVLCSASKDDVYRVSYMDGNRIPKQYVELPWPKDILIASDGIYFSKIRRGKQEKNSLKFILTKLNKDLEVEFEREIHEITEETDFYLEYSILLCEDNESIYMYIGGKEYDGVYYNSYLMAIDRQGKRQWIEYVDTGFCANEAFLNDGNLISVGYKFHYRFPTLLCYNIKNKELLKKEFAIESPFPYGYVKNNSVIATSYSGDKTGVLLYYIDFQNKQEKVYKEESIFSKIRTIDVFLSSENIPIIVGKENRRRPQEGDEFINHSDALYFIRFIDTN